MHAYFEPWRTYHHPAVRQLAFAVASPNILHSLPTELPLQHAFEFHASQHWTAHYARYEVKLRALDLNPAPLLDFLAQLKSTRLGLRFEYLMWYWLLDTQYHDYQLLGHSIQIFQGRTTLGEIDFLLFNQVTQQVEHWEVALKYYLAEHQAQLAHWYGLNRSDTLQRKLKHFTEQQFRFAQVEEHVIGKRYAIMKGQLYFPLPKTAHTCGYMDSTCTNIAVWVNTERRLGQWGHRIMSKDYYRLQRQEWICPDENISSAPAHWWCNGLYHDAKTQQDYMFRQAPMLYNPVK